MNIFTIRILRPNLSHPQKLKLIPRLTRRLIQRQRLLRSRILIQSPRQMETRVNQSMICQLKSSKISSTPSMARSF